MSKETLEEAAENDFNILQEENPIFPDNHIWPFKLGYLKGAKWQAEQSQEAINKLIRIIEWYDGESDVRPDAETFMWFEQFKKK
jgi:hypothetical protein